MSIQKHLFGVLPDGRETYRYILRNGAGMTACILDFGGTLQQLLVPDRTGRFTDVIGGYDSVYDYLTADGYQGALIGRWGNRIAKAAFTLDGVEYKLAKNDGNNHLHGGTEGFNHKIWAAEPVDGEEPALRLSYVSPDGEEGYPGTLSVRVTYTLKKENALSIRYEATTDKRTVLNLTNHSYFNLGGFGSGKVLDHMLQLDASGYLATDDELIPTGEIVDVTGTPFDFRTPKAIGKDIGADDKALKIAGGYDHCFVFGGKYTGEMLWRGTLYDPKSGREMRMYTDQPCVQCYTANFLDDPEHPFKGGYPQGKQNAVCLETQKMPDSMHHEGFTDCVLNPGERYDFTTIYAFSAK